MRIIVVGGCEEAVAVVLRLCLFCKRRAKEAEIVWVSGKRECPISRLQFEDSSFCNNEHYVHVAYCSTRTVGRATLSILAGDVTPSSMFEIQRISSYGCSRCLVLQATYAKVMRLYVNKMSIPEHTSLLDQVPFYLSRAPARYLQQSRKMRIKTHIFHVQNHQMADRMEELVNELLLDPPDSCVRMGSVLPRHLFGITRDLCLLMPTTSYYRVVGEIYAAMRCLSEALFVARCHIPSLASILYRVAMHYACSSVHDLTVVPSQWDSLLVCHAFCVTFGTFHNHISKHVHTRRISGIGSLMDTSSMRLDAHEILRMVHWYDTTSPIFELVPNVVPIRLIGSPDTHSHRWFGFMEPVDEDTDMIVVKYAKTIWDQLPVPRRILSADREGSCTLSHLFPGCSVEEGGCEEGYDGCMARLFAGGGGGGGGLLLVCGKGVAARIVGELYPPSGGTGVGKERTKHPRIGHFERVEPLNCVFVQMAE